MKVLSKKEIKSWTAQHVSSWLHEKGFSEKVFKSFEHNNIDGPVLLELTDEDLSSSLLNLERLGDIKKLRKEIKILRNGLGMVTEGDYVFRGTVGNMIVCLMSLVYVGVVSFFTALIMTIVHAKVPDQEKYRPLPDVILDNLPLIPFAFEAVEYICCGLIFVFFLILVFHRHRFIVLSRFNVIIGTVFLLRCVTMWATSLSVPGNHTNCDQNQVNVTNTEALIDHAWKITTGMGMAVQGVRTCGDYMFSGHTVVLTTLNFAINQYTPYHWRGLHISSFVLNVFGMFLILAAHEHYTIDVIIAYFITSRLFDYYHTVANARLWDQQLQFSYFVFAYVEEGLLAVVPNSYEYPWDSLVRFLCSKKVNKYYFNGKAMKEKNK